MRAESSFANNYRCMPIHYKHMCYFRRQDFLELGKQVLESQANVYGVRIINASTGNPCLNDIQIADIELNIIRAHSAPC